MNKENTKKQTELMMQFEFDKKEAAAQLEQKRKDDLAKEEEERQKVIRNAFMIGFILVAIALFFIYRGYRQKQKANQIISKQKEEVEAQKALVEAQKHVVDEKQKEIIDSIYYASRIQRALITNEKYINKNLIRLQNKK